MVLHFIKNNVSKEAVANPLRNVFLLIKMKKINTA